VFCREFYSRRVYAFFVLFFWGKKCVRAIFYTFRMSVVIPSSLSLLDNSKLCQSAPECASRDQPKATFFTQLSTTVTPHSRSPFQYQCKSNIIQHMQYHEILDQFCFICLNITFRWVHIITDKFLVIVVMLVVEGGELSVGCGWNHLTLYPPAKDFGSRVMRFRVLGFLGLRNQS